MDYGPNFWRIAGQSLQTEHAAYDDRGRGRCTAGFACVCIPGAPGV